jgi:ubiquinone/menaquinone biosynthesis C-methylase UbiE
MSHSAEDTGDRPTVVSTSTRRGLFSPPPRLEREEHIDALTLSDGDCARTFGDIARVNRFLGGTHAVLEALAPLMAAAAKAKQRSAAAPIRLLDIGTGSADIPRAIVHANRAGRFPANARRALLIRAIDSHAAVLNLAKRMTPRMRYPGIEIEEADALALPYPDGAFDIALCSQTLHHFSRPQCLQILREMDRVTTIGFVVNDLIRDRTAAFWIQVWMWLTLAHPSTRHDAPTSVLRAFTMEEYADLLHDAGFDPCTTTLRRVPLYRATLIHQKTLVREGKEQVGGEP